MLEICLLINVIIPIVYVIIYRNTKTSRYHSKLEL